MVALIFLMILNSKALFANDWDNTKWYAAFDEVKGCITFNFMYYDDYFAAAGEDGGFIDEGVTIWAGGQEIYKLIASKKKDDKYFQSGEVKNGMSISGYEFYTEDGGEYWLRFNWYFPKQNLNLADLNIKIKGIFWNYGVGYPDDDVDDTKTVSTTYDALSKPVITGSTYIADKSMSISWTKALTSTLDSYGKIEFCKKDGTVIQTVNTKASGSVTVTDMDLNNGSIYYVRHYYTPTNALYTYEISSDDYTSKAYPQVSGFSSTFNADDKKVELEWDIPSGGNNCIDDDNFKIVRKNLSNNVINTLPLVAYVGGQTSYSCDDNFNENIENNYAYTIYRTHTEGMSGWPDFDKRDTVEVSTSHRYVENINAVISADQKTITISWDNQGKLWLNTAQLVLTKQNISTGSYQEIILDKSYTDSITGTYVDSYVGICQEYVYSLQVKPNNTAYTTRAKITSESVVPVKIGNILSANASKGYFSDRTEISWETDGVVVDLFSIKSRIYGSNAAFEQIDQVFGSNASKYYQYNDVKCNPGEIYEYQIIGLVQCAGETKSTDTLYTYGFRTPTGNIYGRVTFENGQAVENVEVRLESEDGVMGKSMELTMPQFATIDSNSFLESQTDSITMQAWIAPNAVAAIQKIYSKSDMYELGINNDHFYFKVGTQTLSSSTTVSSYLQTSDFVHLSAVSSANNILLYINGVLKGQAEKSGSILGNTNQFRVGEDYAGIIDEVRIWNRPLKTTEILRDYNRYLTGGEEGLIAYWSFNFATDTEFYDRSYEGSTYHENHGKFNGAVLNSTKIPTNEQLGYKGVTGADGSYEICAIPYIGNGTVYTVIPRMGIHTFESQEEVRFIGEGSQSHTVNFIDKSSFKVTGTITYEGGTIPVEGVSFTIDGVVSVRDNGTVIMTDATGEFEIQVPVGSHEVIAKKMNHVFENEGRITDSRGVNLNYQDEVLGLILKDITTVKYIGRVAGGAIQDAYPLGFSLSENNLADGISISLTYKNPAYEISSIERSESFEHLTPSSKHGSGWPKTNTVDYGAKTITIYPNAETGEFIAEVIPESYTLNIKVPGHDEVPGSGEDLNLSQRLVLNSTVYEYLDSIQNGNDWEISHYSDTVYFHAAQKFIKRYTPTVRISQVDGNGNALPYFGETEYTMHTLGNADVVISLYSNSTYLLGKPVFFQNDYYDFKAEVFEKYVYCTDIGQPKAGIEVDEVATQDASIQFTNNLSNSVMSEVEADSLGTASYCFQVTHPELTSGIRAVSAKIYYGSDDNRTSINWDGAFTGIIVGAVQTGFDFVTGGPNNVLMVLRDPPGSNSYSYLEKGISVRESHKYSGNLKNTGSESWTQDLGFVLTTFTGVGAGTIQTIESESGYTLGIEHQETLGGSYTKESSNTFTTRFQTSADPLYVGADADVFIGYSTNIAYGSTENVNIISRTKYYENTAKYQVYKAITPLTSNYLLVRQTGLGVAQTFGTLFAFPQSHIENKLLPEMIALRNNFLMQEEEVDVSTLQSLANNLDTTFYVSHLAPDEENFGMSNSDTNAFTTAMDPDPDDVFNGASYQVIYPQRADFVPNDTILFLNQSMENWHTQLSANEEAKLNASLLQNYSFQGGSPISYSESYSTVSTDVQTFDVMIGGSIQNKWGVKIKGNGFTFSFKEEVTTTHGVEHVAAETQQHAKGFVLSDNYKDYISVDVMNENADQILDTLDAQEDFYPTFIFRTKAGATSCPYEGEYVTKYYQKGQHVIDQATKKIEVPEIAVENDFVENVPSGGVAYFTLYLRNNSEIKQDNWFTLKIVEDSNPNGAKLSIDGASIGNGKDFLVPADGTLTKTLEVGKGSVLNYDNLRLVLESQCQRTISDTVNFTVHFTPSCSAVEIDNPSDQWTYNTKLPTVTIEGVDKHYMDVSISGFDVNYDSFNRIKFQYKSAAESDDAWKTFMNYYADSTLYQKALDDGWNAEFINPNDGGVIKYLLKMDDLPDQRYDLRAVSVCLINNEEIENVSETVSGIKDMLCPRLFGSPQPANGILTIVDEIRLNFNEQIAEGLLTKNNFQVQGIRNGAQSDHSVSVDFDGLNDFMETEFDKNMAGKDITVELWIKSDQPQKATLFSHGNINESLELSLTEDNHLKLKVGSNIVTSQNAIPFEAGSWAHIALVYSKEGSISAYYNFSEVISNASIGYYEGIGNFVLGKNISENADYFNGFMHNVRVWNKILSSGEIQVNSLSVLSGNEPGLLAYYPMTAAKGSLALDKARGANMIMNGCKWSIPPGRSMLFNGLDSYVKMNTGSSAVIKKSMDFTIEFWFKGDPSQANVSLLSNGRGDGQDMGGSANLFSIEFNANGKLRFVNNGFVSSLDADYLDNNWHHFALNVNRTFGRGQIYMDGNMINYFDAAEIGGIASAHMYLGARAWYSEGNNSDLKMDQFFKGEIDELRIWNLYKDEQLIQQNNNVKLEGTEMGLLAYYPFECYKEYQGINELDSSLADMKIQRDIANVVPDAEAFNIVQTADIPPVKDRGPVSDLEFDFVVNDDALIIYLEETWEKVEKTIVTFTVDGVQDVNGNENISPITWSAYIDRNQLKWSETELNLAKGMNEPLEFSVKAINNGGSIQHYTIENMPSWMEIYPTSGTINPSSSTDIEFIIDDGLNIGSYNEVIYMRNDNNVSEALEINIVVRGEKPDWVVNPADFDQNMAVFGKMRFNNIFSADQDDMLAAFNEGKCIGVTTSTYIRDMDMWYALLTIYGNKEQSDQIEFRMWDASTGITYSAYPEVSISFEIDAVVGTPDKLVIFDAKDMVYQKIDLVEGWNWISFNVHTEALDDLNVLLANMNWKSSDYFKSEFDSKSANYSENESQWIYEGSTFSLNNVLMYKLLSSVSQSINLSGEVIKPSIQPLSVKGNLWNYIGYLPNVRLTLKEALAGYDAKTEDVIKSQNAFAMYSETVGWLGSLGFMEPGKGYMLYRNDASGANLVYPDHVGSMITKSKEVDNQNFGYVNVNHSANMNLVAVCDVSIKDDDRILAYVGSELSSESLARYVNKEHMFFITVTGENDLPLSFELERDGEIIGVAEQFFQFKNNEVLGTLSNPMVLAFKETEAKIRVFPNPTNNYIRVAVSYDNPAKIEISIVDVVGKELIKKRANLTFGDLSETLMDCSCLKPGIYFVNVLVDGNRYVYKISKQ